MPKIKRADLIQLGYRIELGECKSCILQGKDACGSYGCNSEYGRSTVQDPKRQGLLLIERLLIKRNKETGDA